MKQDNRNQNNLIPFEWRDHPDNVSNPQVYIDKLQNRDDLLRQNEDDASKQFLPGCQQILRDTLLDSPNEQVRSISHSLPH